MTKQEMIKLRDNLISMNLENMEEGLFSSSQAKAEGWDNMLKAGEMFVESNKKIGFNSPNGDNPNMNFTVKELKSMTPSEINNNWDKVVKSLEVIGGINNGEA